jgi:hypothetical protein
MWRSAVRYKLTVRGVYCLHHQGDLSQFFERGLLIALMTEAVRSSETSVNFYRTTQCNIQKTVIFMCRCDSCLNSVSLLRGKEIQKRGSKESTE